MTRYGRSVGGGTEGVSFGKASRAVEGRVSETWRGVVVLCCLSVQLDIGRVRSVGSGETVLSDCVQSVA